MVVTNKGNLENVVKLWSNLVNAKKKDFVSVWFLTTCKVLFVLGTEIKPSACFTITPKTELKLPHSLS